MIGIVGNQQGKSSFIFNVIGKVIKMLKFKISLVKKYDFWVFRKGQMVFIMEKYGYILIKIFGEGVYVKVKLVIFKKYNC